MHSLEDAVRFYVERDLKPAKWYSRDARGKTVAYDDLPPALRGNIDDVDPPFNRRAGEKPALNDQEIRDVVAFLKTLNDGYPP